ncbi:hypothetical protein D3C87_111000 [compost metagenome]
MSKLGLVLSGGGARGAYQAGVLAAIAEVAAQDKVVNPFKIMTGVSAGSINASILAGHSGNLLEATQYLTKLWGNITTDEVFYVNLKAISKGGLDWLDLPFKTAQKEAQLYSLFSTTPLRSLLAQACHFENIEKKIQKRILHALSVSALEYDSISTTTFFQGHESIIPWERPMHRSERTSLNVDHVMASTAIPILFPPIKVDKRYYGDGCIRNQSPCSPAIYMGAERFIAVGVRRRHDTWFTYHHNEEGTVPSLIRMINVIFHSMMMDGIELDLQRISQINAHLALLTKNEKAKVSTRPVDYLWVSPSVDFAKLATQQSSKLPRLIRYLLRGVGHLSESSELISYLLFDGVFCNQLMEVGFADGMKEKDGIRKILEL